MRPPAALRRPQPRAEPSAGDRLPSHKGRNIARRLRAWVAGLVVLFSAVAPGLAQPDGRLLVEAMEYPWSAIGRVNARGVGHCTGFLIGPRHVMTAAHCLYNAVEGRWLGSNELHFVAGYQRDQFIIHSKVSSYEKSDKFDAVVDPNGVEALDDWAILRLARPIGHTAGWLGLMAPSPATLPTLFNGSRQLMQAGYRSGRAHAMTANPSCRILGRFEGSRGLAHDCAVFRGDSGSPLLLFAGGEVRVIAMEVILFDLDGRQVGAAISMSALRGDHDPQAVRALRRIGNIWQGGHAPEPGGLAAHLPFGTIDRLLVRLGYAKDGDVSRRSVAIRAFQEDRNIAVTGQPSLELLSQLLGATP